jgi:hypothetical protein
MDITLILYACGKQGHKGIHSFSRKTWMEMDLKETGREIVD